MIRFRAFRTNFSIPLLTLFFPILAGRLGLEGAFPAVPLALCVHELAHLVTARLLGVEIREIQLTPFGGSAKIENPYRQSGLRMFIVALAGPAANLLLALLCAALAQWQLVRTDIVLPLMQLSLFMMFFNLLPALPLDGGRMLYCILQRPLGEARALRICLLAGRLLAAGLCLLAVWGYVRYRKLNLTYVLAAVFILTSAPAEREAQSTARAAKVLDVLAPKPQPQRMQLYEVDADLPARDVLSLLKPQECAWLLLMQNQLPYGLMDARGLLRHLTEHDSSGARLADLPCYLLGALARQSK